MDLIRFLVGECYHFHRQALKERRLGFRCTCVIEKLRTIRGTTTIPSFYRRKSNRQYSAHVGGKISDKSISARPPLTGSMGFLPVRGEGIVADPLYPGQFMANRIVELLIRCPEVTLM